MHYERYSDTMFNLGYGYPLFQADPYDLRETLPGDAGYMQSGKFIPRWNHWGTAGPSSLGVVEELIPVPGPLHAGTFKEIRTGVDIGATTSMGGGQIRMKYECASSTCAILSLKDRQMNSINLTCDAERELRKNIQQNIKRILESCQLDDYKRLIFVTGVSKTGDWDTVVINSDDHEAEAEASIDVLELDLIKTSFAIKYRSTQTPHFRSGHHHTRNQRCGESCEDNKNQTVFIRRLLVRKAMRVGPLVLKAAAEPKDPDVGDSDSDGGGPAVAAGSLSSTSSTFELTDGESQFRGNSRIEQAESSLFRYIFENSDAKYAMVHDRDVVEWISRTEGFTSPAREIITSEDGEFAELSTELPPPPTRTADNISSVPICPSSIPSSSNQMANTVESDYAKTLRTMNRRADDFRSKGKYTEAETVRRMILEHRKSVFGSDHVDTLRTMANLASDLHLQGNYVEAEEVRRAALMGQIKVLGSEHVDTLRTIHNLASDLHRLERYNEAESHRRVALESRKRILGPEDVDTLYTMHSLASDLSSVQKYGEAEEVRRAAMEGRQKVLGVDHVDTLRTTHSLASDLRHLEKYTEAEEIGRAVLEGRQRTLGPNHTHTLRTMDNLASDLRNQEKYSEAEEVERAILDGRMAVLGADHEDTLRSIDNIVSDLRSQGRYSEAEAIYPESDVES